MLKGCSGGLRGFAGVEASHLAALRLDGERGALSHGSASLRGGL